MNVYLPLYGMFNLYMLKIGSIKYGTKQ